MKWILPIRSSLAFYGMSQPVEVVRGLGGGSQGQVYEVLIQDRIAALKWYFPASLKLDPQLRHRLVDCIRAGEPTDSFLWPMALLSGHQELACHGDLVSDGFGYLMPIRPPQYIPAIDHYAGRIQLSIATVLRACLNLCTAFHALHSKGLCYRDISLGNLFLDPEDGRILICDNDNVGIEGMSASAVLGTPGYMAPEVLLRKASPCRSSDLFSLASLLFRLLTRHDPFRGLAERDIPCLDEVSMRRLYGEDPVFIFHPNDQRNRPDPDEHLSALLTWPIYPQELHQLFVQSFVTGLHEPSRRTLTGEWTKQISATLDLRQLCCHCGQENFRDALGDAEPGNCWACRKPLRAPAWLVCEAGRIAVSKGNAIYQHHLSRFAPVGLENVVALVNTNPQRPDVHGLQNLGSTPWQADLISGDSIAVPPGRSANLILVRSILTHWGRIDVHQHSS